MISAQRIGDFASGILIGLCLGVGLGMMIGTANADGVEVVAPAEVAAVGNMVVDTLREQGFDVHLGELPPVYIIRIDDGNVSETTGRSVRINDRMPAACRTRLVAHELAHIFVARSYGARDDAEGVAIAVEDIVAPEYQPGCDRVPRAPTLSSLELRGAVS